MPLRRFQPISRAAQWSDTVRWIDPRTRQPQSLADAVLTMALYPMRGSVASGWWRGGDYGWPLSSRPDAPLLSAVTQPDGSGPFVILPDLVTAQWTFPSGSLANVWPGDALLVVWATVGGQTDEIQRATIRVLDGPRAMPIIGQNITIPSDVVNNTPAQQAAALAALVATLPTTLPATSGVLWNNGGVLQVS